MRVLFVCLGNICRSAMAEGIFAQVAAARGLSDIVIDSAGTGSWHVGEAPDRRAQAALARRGIDISSLRARQVQPSDFDDFDLVLAMDRDNLANLERAAPEARRHKVRLFMAFAPAMDADEVPDPYYGGDGGFDEVFAMVEAACNGLADHVLAARS